MDLGSGGEKAPLHPTHLVLLCHSKKPTGWWAGDLESLGTGFKGLSARTSPSTPSIPSSPPLLHHVQLKLGKRSLYFSSSSSTIGLTQPTPEAHTSPLLSLSFFSPSVSLVLQPLLREVLLGFAPALSTVPKMASLPVHWHPTFNPIIPRSVLHICVSNMTQ